MNQKLENLVHGVKRHISDGTAVNVVYSPLYALMETSFAGMSHAHSQDSRLLGAAIVYAGLGNLVGKGRDFSKKMFKIDDNTPEKIRKIHDVIYLAATPLLINPPFYLAVGVRDVKEIAIGTLAGCVLGAVGGIPMGYSIDYFRDLIGVEKSERMPAKISHLKPRAKKLIASGLVALSIGLTGIVYEMVPDKDNKNVQTQEIVAKENPKPL